MAARTRFPDFELANPLYRGAGVTAFTVDAAGVKTSTKATLYEGPTGPNTLANPQTLDSEGKFVRPVYFDQPIIAVVDAIHVTDHDSGIIFPLGLFRGDWVTGTLYYPSEIVRDGAGGGNTQDIYAAQSIHLAGTWATDAADATKLRRMVNVGGATLGVSLPLGIASGGTGAASAPDARRSLGLTVPLHRLTRAWLERHVFLSTAAR